MLLNIQIREYDEDLFAPVTLLWRRAREESLPEFQREKGHPFEEDQVYFRDHILNQDTIWVAEEKSLLVGFKAVRNDFIDLLYVDPKYWRKRVGQALLDHARNLSPSHLWLFTLQINHNARVFYQKNGFTAQRFGVSPPPESEPDVEYHWYYTER